METDITKQYSIIFKALSDPQRLKIFSLLGKGKTCACKILEEFNFTQPTLSYHMKLLCDSGLVVGEKDGKWVHYSINIHKIEEINEFFSKFSTNCLVDNCSCKD